LVKTLIASELPLNREINGNLGSVAVRIRSIGPGSCTLEHQRQIRIATDAKLLLRWNGQQFQVAVKVLRSRLGPLSAGGMGYHTTVELVEPAPETARALEEILGEARPDAGAQSPG
jgi:hypothetical protein